MAVGASGKAPERSQNARVCARAPKWQVLAAQWVAAARARGMALASGAGDGIFSGGGLLNRKPLDSERTLIVRGELALATRDWHFMRRENGVARFFRIREGEAEVLDVTDSELMELGRKT